MSLLFSGFLPFRKLEHSQKQRESSNQMRSLFDRFFLSDQLLPRPSSPHTACNFTGSRKDWETFECWLHDRARGLNVTWRSLRNPSSWVLHRRTSRDRRDRLARVRCKCT